MVRIKERYLLVNILYPPEQSKSTRGDVPNLVVQHQPTTDNLTPSALMRAIRAEATTLYGDCGAGAFEGHLSVKYLSLATSTFILRCAREHYQMLWSILTFMDHIPVKEGKPCIFRVVRVSGTIRKAEEEAIRQARLLILGAKEQSELQQSRSLLTSTTTTTAATTPTSMGRDQIMLDVEDDMSDEDMDDEDDDGDDDG